MRSIEGSANTSGSGRAATPNSWALASARLMSISVQATSSRPNARQFLKYVPLIWPQPTMAILVFVSTRQSLSDQILVTLADRFHNVGVTAIEFHHQPFGRCGASCH